VSRGLSGEPGEFGFWDEEPPVSSGFGLYHAGVRYPELFRMTDPVSRAMADALRVSGVRGWYVHSTMVGDDVMTGVVLGRTAGRLLAARITANATARKSGIKSAAGSVCGMSAV
jgi:hypothetical protein